jgi:hypothetical protein
MTETFCGSYEIQFVIQQFRKPWLGNYAFPDVCWYKLFLLSTYKQLIPEVMPCTFHCSIFLRTHFLLLLSCIQACDTEIQVTKLIPTASALSLLPARRYKTAWWQLEIPNPDGWPVDTPSDTTLDAVSKLRRFQFSPKKNRSPSFWFCGQNVSNGLKFTHVYVLSMGTIHCRDGVCLGG